MHQCQAYDNKQCKGFSKIKTNYFKGAFICHLSDTKQYL